MTEDHDDPLLTPEEVAALFRVDPKTVSRWAKDRKIKCLRTPGGHYRFRTSVVRAKLQEGVTEEITPELVEAAHAMGFTELVARKRSTTPRHEVSFIPGEPFVSEAFGPREGYVVGTCRHAVAQSEWNAGLRKCERC